MRYITHVKKIAAGLGVVTALTAITVMPALADEGISQTITGGAFSVASTDLTFVAQDWAYDMASSTANMDLTVTDDTGTGGGWTVTLTSGDLVSTNDTIEASQISAAIGAAGLTNNTGAPETAVSLAATGGALASGLAVLTADGATDEGMGSYDLDLDISIDFDEGQKAGTYVGNLDITSVPATP